jgi:hypothetical protein
MILTLFLVPSIYLIVEGIGETLRGWLTGRRPAPAGPAPGYAREGNLHARPR